MLRLNERQTAAVLAGLHMFQQNQQNKRKGLPYADYLTEQGIESIATNGHRLEALDHTEIDELCEKVNLDDRNDFVCNLTDVTNDNCKLKATVNLSGDGSGIAIMFATEKTGDRCIDVMTNTIADVYVELYNDELVLRAWNIDNIDSDPTHKHVLLTAGDIKNQEKVETQIGQTDPAH